MKEFIQFQTKLDSVRKIINLQKPRIIVNSIKIALAGTTLARRQTWLLRFKPKLLDHNFIDIVRAKQGRTRTNTLYFDRSQFGPNRIQSMSYESSMVSHVLRIKKIWVRIKELFLD